MEKIAYSIAEAVSVSGISRTGIYMALQSGELKGKKWGTRTLIEDVELRRFIADSLPAKAL